MGSLSSLTGCAGREPVSHFVILPADGQEITEAETDRLREALDRVGQQYGMPKVKSGQAGIIRYYQATGDYEIGFFAKRSSSALRVYAEPMTPSVSGTDAYRSFRQNLANVLSQTFPGQVTLEKNE